MHEIMMKLGDSQDFVVSCDATVWPGTISEKQVTGSGQADANGQRAVAVRIDVVDRPWLIAPLAPSIKPD